MVKLPTFIIDEIRASSLHVLVSVADIRAPIASKLWATDATPTCGREVVADIPIALARTLYRHAEDMGSATRIDEKFRERSL